MEFSAKMMNDFIVSHANKVIWTSWEFQNSLKLFSISVAQFEIPSFPIVLRQKIQV